MPDVMTPEQRSRCMSRIRGSNTGPEVRLRKAVWKAGLRYRLRGRVPGKPDFVLGPSKVAVFVDGCFWHGCPLHAVKPKNNAGFWAKKLARNQERDREVNAALAAMGWAVVRFWEHEVEDELDACVGRVLRVVRDRSAPTP